MNSLKSAPQTWVPVSSGDRTMVLEELENVIASAQFCNSKRYPALLRYVVEKTLSGHAEQLKERTLGVEVFHRPADYDTNADTVVRYTAGEVRKRLALYYHQHQESPLQIALPAGSYVPDFLKFPEEPEPEHAESLHSLLAPATRLEEIPLVSQARVQGAPETLKPVGSVSEPPAATSRSGAARLRAVWFLAFLLVLVAVGALLKSAWPKAHAVTTFWAPVLREHGPVLLCIGGNSFDENNFSGVRTASKGTAYPFVSM